MGETTGGDWRERLLQEEGTGAASARALLLGSIDRVTNSVDALDSFTFHAAERRRALARRPLRMAVSEGCGARSPLTVLSVLGGAGA